MRTILLSIIFIFSIQYVSGKDIEKVDSLFTIHIKSVNDTLNKYATSDKMRIAISGEDRVFINMVGFIADFKFEQHGYTHQPMICRQELKTIKKWYKKNRKRINPIKIEQYLLLEKKLIDTYKSIDPKDFLEDNNALDKVFNKMDSLKKVNTYLR